MSGRHAHLLRAVLGGSDAVAALIATGAAYGLRFHVLSAWLPVRGRIDELPARYLAALPAAVLLLVLASVLAGLYAAQRVPRPLGFADAVRVSACAAATLATVALLYWNEFQYSRATLLLAALFYGPLCAALRATALRRVNRHVVATPVVLLGGGRPAQALLRAAASGAWPPISVVAVLPLGDDVAPASATRLRGIEQVVEFLAREGSREAVVAVPAERASEVPSLLGRLEQTTADLRLVPDFGDAVLVNPGATLIPGLAVLSLRERPLYGLRAATKRALDIGLAAVLLVVLAPVLVLIALVVRATSRGPALFVQERMGIDARPFRMLKFRTMRDDAEVATGPVFARPGDPRTTAVGRVLRRFSLDELPQLWNVLRGEMSLVGPRPERAPFIEQFRRRLPGYMLRHTVKSGMTGWAQVHGLRGDSSLEDRLRYDLEYVDRWSLSLDVEILGRTAFQVLAGRNAH